MLLYKNCVVLRSENSYLIMSIQKNNPQYADKHLDLRGIAFFISEYASCLLGSGVHTSRVIRNSRRIGNSLGVKVDIMSFQKSIVITVAENEGERLFTEVVPIPALPICFEYNSELSGLSWDAYDEKLSLPELKERYSQIVSKPKMNPYLVMVLVGFANASFCRLFGGNLEAMGIVLVATLLGFFLKQQLQKKGCNHFIVFTVSAFVSSMVASLSLLSNATTDIAIATSVLYLIPGVPLINGVIDMVEGHTLTGFSRLINALLLIVCIAVGLAFPLFLFKHSLL